MSLTAAQICNIALARVGHRQAISALSEGRAEARLCEVLYPNALNVLLMELHWGFATKRALLALLSGVERDGWEFVYALPSDLLAARYLYPGLRNPVRKQLVPYAMEYEATTSTRVLLTDAEDALLVYTMDQGDSTALFPPHFVDALAWKMAVELSLSLSVKPQVGLAMAAKYEGALLRASAAELSQSQVDVPAESELITGRG